MSVQTGSPDATRRAIYDYIERRGLATKRHIARDLDLSLPTVAKYLTVFLAQGLLQEKTKLASSSRGGRSPIAYSVVPDARHAVGVDVSAHRVVVVLVDLQCNVVARRRAERRFARDADYFAFLGEQIADVVRESGVDRSQILGVGVAVPGLVDPATGEVVYGEAIGNQGLGIQDFETVVDWPVRLFHDSDAAGQAEFWGGDDDADAFYISLSGSIGGSVLLGGSIYTGQGPFAGEIGHLQVEPGGALCYCGTRGCLDPHCNVSVLTRAGDGDLDTFFARLDAGDTDAAAVWDRYTTHLARAVHDVRTLFGCRVILGGDVGPHTAGRLDLLRTKVDELSFRPDPAAQFLHPCARPTDPIATGAALFLVEQFKHDPAAALAG